MAIEIFALMLKQSKCKPHKIKRGTSHILNIYADNLTIYLEMKQNQNFKNLRNVQEVIKILELFQKWCGLSINKGKTYTMNLA